ncbi:tetratricopeptide repeat protein 23 isoform X3 [Meriones unguiculatus]|nr:tetratricopeptide repeat protein 23 isoform X3 [Meriones unguiculatus]XP_021490339.1 tetratricopeptide repeat protein 23 isoform X3 [Meriones unguiculatus]XP_021490341.1 tetratricopeptide repeat protein 23 isoform X3 [Meriones unguiculatus]XP_021490342.1 tetratricopeptide repeat protein 23 isoform X3 [Meriones unguiculatus]XP_021490344.1 tetratricopeptide repeat protein 23 isoform X3 [Meriones unguiculatus]
MQESQEIQMSNHLDEVIAAVSVTSKKKIPNKLLQTALFQPPREKLRLCEERAKSYSSSHEYKQAIQELVRCVALTRICYGDSHCKLAEAYVNLSQGYLQMKGLSLQAKQHAEKAKEILANAIESPYHNNADVFRCSIELFYTLGRAFLALQKFKEASENLIKAEKLAKEMLQCGKIIKEEWIEIQARLKLSFAQLYQGQKRSKEALHYYQKALEYTEIVKDEKSLECVPVLRELAGVEQALGLHDAAINHFSQAHLIVLSKDPSPSEAADSAHSIARAAVASGMHNHHDVAEKYFQESMTHVKDSEGAARAKFLSIQDEFCNFLQIAGQKERATMILRESLEAKVGAFGDFSPEVAETYRVLGRTDLAQGNHTGAHTKLKKGIRGQGEDTSITKECAQIETFLYGSHDKRTLATQQTIDKIPEAPGKSRQSLKTKVAFCTSVPQHTVSGKARHNAD